MALPGTLDVQLFASAGPNLRLRIVLRMIASQAPVGEPISVQRLENSGSPAKVSRLARVAKPEEGFTELAAVPANSNDALVVELGDPTAGSPGNWFWTIYVETSAGGGPFLRVRHPKAKELKLPIGAQAKEKNTSEPVRKELHTDVFPRLIVALNAAPVAVLSQHRPAGDPGFGKVEDLAAVLRHIEARLVTPKTASNPDLRPDALEDAWKFETKTGLLPRVPRPDGHVALAEELWARQVSEMLDITPYGGPGVTYGADATLDVELMMARIDGPHPDPAYSIVYACQHLVSFALASRARAAHRFPPYKQSREYISAGSACAGLVRRMKGQWVVNGKPPELVDPALTNPGPDDLKCEESLQTAEKLFEIHDMEGCEFGPGSLFVFANRAPKTEVDPAKGTRTDIVGDQEITTDTTGKLGKNGKPLVLSTWKIQGKWLADNAANAHVAFVLRTDRRLKLFQPLDTGGLGVANRGAGVTVLNAKAGFHTGNYDDPAATKVNGGDPFRGVGIWPKLSTAEAEALDKHVENTLKKARPLGLVRFLLVRAGATFTQRDAAESIAAGDVLFASPLVRMYRDDPAQNYSIARLVWAMRSAPVGGAKALCWIYVPRGAMARAMLDGGRTAKVADMARTVFAAIKSPETRKKLSKDPDLLVAKLLAAHTMPVIDMEVHGDDKVRVTAKLSKKGADMHKLHHAEVAAWNGKIILPMDRAFVVGGQSTTGMPAYFLEP
jgi:hypothetical protein